MKNNSISIVINDPNRFYVDGLKNFLNEYFSKINLKPAYSDSLFTQNADIVFLSSEMISVANGHFLNRRTSANKPLIFIISEDKNRNFDNEILKADYTLFFRNESIENIKSTLATQFRYRPDLREIISSSCASRTPEKKFTRREAEILRYLARGISNGAVARFLHISEKTVSAHKRNIMTKLNMIRTAELNYWLIQEGWCESLRNRHHSS